jgi:dihydrofolate reductase
MKKLVLKMSVSLDGFVCGPNGEIDWVFDTLDEAASAWLVDTLWQAGVHLMGSATYRDMAAWWPQSTEVYAAPMNEIPKFVFSHTLKEADWTDSRIIDGDLATEIGRLKQLPGRDMLAHGGARFAQSLVRLGLVDEYRLVVHPVLLGAGKALFSDLPAPLALKLMHLTQFPSGAVAKVYRPLGVSCEA